MNSQFNLFVLISLFSLNFVYAKDHTKWFPLPTTDGLVTVIPIKIDNTINPECSPGYRLIYVLHSDHMSESISNTSNKIKLKKICQKDKILKYLNSNIIGTFANKPSLYNIYYSSEDKPTYGYDKYQHYSGTEYYGLPEQILFASHSKAELISKINQTIEDNSCTRWPANTSGGNLNNNDNFWTYFCPKKDLVTYLRNLSF